MVNVRVVVIRDYYTLVVIHIVIRNCYMWLYSWFYPLLLPMVINF